MSIVYIGGTFDVPHYGHFKLFETAKKIGQEVVVALNTDSFVLQYKGKLPIMNYREREFILRSCGNVTTVVANKGGFDSKLLIEQIGPQFILHGDDWVGDPYLEQLGVTEEWLESKDITVLYTPYNKATSSTKIKSLIKKS